MNDVLKDFWEFVWPFQFLIFYLVCLGINLVREFGVDAHLHFKAENGINYRIRMMPKCRSLVDFFIKGRSNHFYHTRSGNSFVYTTIFQLSLSLLVLQVMIGISLLYVNSLGLSNKVEVSPFYFATFVLILFGSIFWNERQGYYSKWEYVSNSFKNFQFEQGEPLKRLKFVDFLHDCRFSGLEHHFSCS